MELQEVQREMVELIQVEEVAEVDLPHLHQHL
jgi:hypothetical protein